MNYNLNNKLTPSIQLAALLGTVALGIGYSLVPQFNIMGVCEVLPNSCEFNYMSMGNVIIAIGALITLPMVGYTSMRPYNEAEMEIVRNLVAKRFKSWEEQHWDRQASYEPAARAA